MKKKIKNKAELGRIKKHYRIRKMYPALKKNQGWPCTGAIKISMFN